MIPIWCFVSVAKASLIISVPFWKTKFWNCIFHACILMEVIFSNKSFRKMHNDSTNIIVTIENKQTRTKNWTTLKHVWETLIRNQYQYVRHLMNNKPYCSNIRLMQWKFQRYSFTATCNYSSKLQYLYAHLFMYHNRGEYSNNILLELFRWIPPKSLAVFYTIF